jgi:NADH-quinone oxidoreductase subunit J
MVEYIFYVLSGIAIACALLVVFSKNPIHSVLYLILTFFAIAGHYILLNAQFLAIVHIIVYAGAIMVLFLFVIMLLNLNAETEPHKNTLTKVMATVSGGLLMLTMVGSFRVLDEKSAMINVHNSNIGTIENLGQVLFNQFLLPFEISSILFLSAMIGAVILGKKQLQ